MYKMYVHIRYNAPLKLLSIKQTLARLREKGALLIFPQRPFLLKSLNNEKLFKVNLKYNLVFWIPAEWLGSAAQKQILPATHLVVCSQVVQCKLQHLLLLGRHVKIPQSLLGNRSGVSVCVEPSSR